jgi:phosphoglycolate phosphatase
MNKLTAVFDLDGTLVDTLPDFTLSINRLFARLGLAAASDAELQPMLGDGPKVFLERALAARGIDADARMQADFIDDYTEHAAVDSQLYPGMAEALVALRRQGLQLAVCTNKPAASTILLLQALQIDELFVAIGAGDSHPFRKPDPRHLHHTLQLADTQPGRAVMIGDNRNDYLAAKGAGTAFVFAEWGYGRLDEPLDIHGVRADSPLQLIAAVPQLLALARAS